MPAGMSRRLNSTGRTCAGGTEVGLPSFPLEKKLFDRQTRAVPAESAVGCDHSMARNKNGDGVIPARLPDGAGSLRPADPLCDILVGSSLPERDAAELLEYLPLEICSGVHVQGEGRNRFPLFEKIVNGGSHAVKEGSGRCLLDPGSGIQSVNGGTDDFV